MQILRATVFVLNTTLALITLGCGTTASGQTPELQTLDSQKLLSLDGAWISRGYGLLWHIKAGRAAEFEISGRSCIFRETQDGLPDTAGPVLLLDKTKRVMRIQVNERIGYLHTFDRHDALPSQCKKKPDTSPASVFDAVDQIFTHHYAFFGARKLNWRKLVQTHRHRLAKVKTDTQLFRLIADLLNTIGDEHVSLRGIVNGERKRFSATGKPIALPPRLPESARLPGAWSPAAGERLLGPLARRNASNTITYGLIDKDIGYLKISSLWGRRVPDLDPTLDRAFALFQRARLMIVDVSSNGGGSEYLGKRVAERFVSARTIGLYKYAGDAKGAKRQAIYVVPSPRKRFLGPTFVISSRETFSAAETLVMFMAVLGNVTHIGHPTGGALSDVLTRRLPNGWRVGLSNEIYLDVKGRSWEGIGVPPQIHLDVDPNQKNVKASHLAAARKTLAAIRALAEKTGVRD